jgi:hypothetical protein
MSKVTAFYENSDDNGQRPNSDSVPSLPCSSKRLRDKKESRNDSGRKAVTGSAKFVFDLELADGVEVVSPSKKRHRVAKVIPNGENYAVRNCAQILKGVNATEKDVDGEDAQGVDHRDFHEGTDVTVAASHSMNSDSEQTGHNSGSANEHFEKQEATKPPSNALGFQGRASLWEDRLTELTEYFKIHGHCDVPQGYSKTAKLCVWVRKQRKQYRLYVEGENSTMTLFRLQELEILDFEWATSHSASTWEFRLSELTDYRQKHGHCNVPQRYSENTKLGTWVSNQRNHYRLHREGKTSSMTTFRIQELESLGFEWKLVSVTAWEDRLSELADYCKIHGHCNVPQRYSENSKLGRWVADQRNHYTLHLRGKISHMTPFRIQALESLGFEWKCRGRMFEKAC